MKNFQTILMFHLIIYKQFNVYVNMLNSFKIYWTMVND